MRWNPEVTVAAIVEIDGRFLMVEERMGDRLVLNQPAGHLEDRETLLEAAVRETREETAWRFHPEALVGVYLWRSPVTERSFLRVAFCGTVDDHQPKLPLDDGIVRTLWMSYEQLLAQPARLRSPLVARCLDDFRRGARQPLESIASLGLDDAMHVDAVVSL
ncbi:MAG TPA: NUDIX hydrolase [Steroidobacteraceae bacterium]|nr:NUDIX hydrolase [Steroidobacteraceae bacterium]